MRMILAGLLLTYSLVGLTAEISCYSGKTRIYHGYGHDLRYNEKFIMFKEYKSKQHLLIDAACMIRSKSLDIL